MTKRTVYKSNDNTIYIKVEEDIDLSNYTKQTREFSYDDICNILDEFIDNYYIELHRNFPGSVMNQVDMMEVQSVVDRIKAKFKSHLGW